MSTATPPARLGVIMQAIANALNNAFGQRQIATIYAQANQYRVILEARSDQTGPSVLTGLCRISVSGSNPHAAQVPLSGATSIRSHAPATIAPLADQHTMTSSPRATHELRCRAWRLAFRCRDGDPAGGARHRHAGLDHQADSPEMPPNSPARSPTSLG